MARSKKKENNEITVNSGNTSAKKKKAKKSVNTAPIIEEAKVFSNEAPFMNDEQSAETEQKVAETKEEVIKQKEENASAQIEATEQKENKVETAIEPKEEEIKVEASPILSSIEVRNLSAASSLSEDEIKRMNVILIDNGHGCNTPGKRSPYSVCKALPEIDFFEFQWNRDIANRVVNNLTKAGYDARLVVSEIEDISLSERVRRINKICDEHGKDNVTLVSIHANAAGNGISWYSAKGWSCYTTKGETKSDKLAECLYDAAEANFVGRKIRKDNSDGDRDFEENFYIIYKSKCAAVLTENFFYDNVDDVKYILSKDGKHTVAKMHVDGIIDYLHKK